MDPSSSHCPSLPCSHAPKCSDLINKAVQNHMLSKCEKFSKYFDVDDEFYISLISRKVLTTSEKRRYQRKISKNEQCSKILTRVIHKTWGHLRNFCYALDDRDEEYILREVFELTKDAELIEVNTQTANQHLTPGKTFISINDAKERLVKIYRERFYRVEVYHLWWCPGLENVTVSVLFCVNRYYGQKKKELTPFETGSLYKALGSKPFELAKYYIDVMLTDEPANGDDTQESEHISEGEMFHATTGLRAEYHDDYKKVLVSGPTGCGKTALTLHSAAQWAMNKQDATSFQDKFSLVMLLDSSSVLRFGVKGAIRQLFHRNDSYTETVWNYLKTDSENCLVIVDDIDNILTNACPATLEEVQDLIQDNLFHGCTLLATSCRELSHQHLIHFQRNLAHNGFLKEQGLQFIQSYFKRNTKSLMSLKEFIHSHDHDLRSIEEIIKRPLWNLTLCQLWELSGRVTGKKLNTTILYSRIEEALVGETLSSDKQQEMRQLYKLCLFGVLQKMDLFERSVFKQFKIRKSSIAFKFLVKRTFVTDDFREDFGFIIPHKTLLFYFAAKEVYVNQCTQSRWIFLNLLLNTETFSEITVFLAGLLNIPNLFDMIFMHTLFNGTTDIQQFKGDCKNGIRETQKMVSEFHKESSGYILERQDPRCQSTLLNMEKIRRESFSQYSKDCEQMADLIDTMVKDVLKGICSKCLTKWYNLVMSQYPKIVWLLRCYYEYTAQKNAPFSIIMEKLKQAHNCELHIGRSRSPYDFLLVEFSKNDCCTLKIPYAQEVAHMEIMADVLHEQVQNGRYIKELHVSVGLCQIPSTGIGTKAAPNISTKIPECLLKLYDQGLAEISFTGLLPGCVAQILPVGIIVTLDKLTVTFLGETDTWMGLMKHISCLDVVDVHLETLDMDATQLLQEILKSSQSFCENIKLLHLGHRTHITRQVFHQYLLHGLISISCENLMLDDCFAAHDFTLDIAQISMNKSLYVIYGEGSSYTGSFLPPHLQLEKVRINDIWSFVNLEILLRDISQEDVMIEDLQIDQLHSSGFVLKAISRHKVAIVGHVSHIRVKYGTYTTDDLREFLLSWTCYPGPKIVLNSPIINGNSIEAISFGTIQSNCNKKAQATVFFSYISGSKIYVPCFPSGAVFEKVSFAGLALECKAVWESIVQDVAKCEIEQLEFYSSQSVNGDPCVNALSKNFHSLTGIKQLVLQRFYFVLIEMIDLINVSNIFPLTLQRVQVGHMKLDSVHLQNADDLDKQHVSICCRYPQDFSDVLPTSHQIKEFHLKLYSDYSQSISSALDSPHDQKSERGFQPRSRQVHSPSSIPESLRSSSPTNSGSLHIRSAQPSLNSSHSPTSPSSNSEHERSFSKSTSSQGSPGDISTSSHPSDDSKSDHDYCCWKDKSHPARSETQSHTSTKSLGGSSNYNSTGTENLSRGTETDSAHSLMKELAKGNILQVVLDLEACEEAACEDILQALMEHSDILAHRINELRLCVSDVGAKAKQEFMKSKLAAVTEFVLTNC